MYKIVRVGENSYQLEYLNYTANVIEKVYFPDIPTSFNKIIKLKREMESFQRSI